MEIIFKDAKKFLAFLSFLCGAWWRHLSCDSPTSLTQWPVCSAVSLIFMCKVRRICFCFWTHRFLEGRAGFDSGDGVCQTFPPVLTFLCVWTCLYQRSGSSPTLWSHPIVLDQSWQTCLAQGTNDWSVWKGSGYTTTAVKILNIKLFIFFIFFFLLPDMWHHILIVLTCYFTVHLSSGQTT